MIKVLPTLASRLSLKKNEVVAQVFGDKGADFFWQQYFLPKWLPLILGFGLGIFIAALVVDGDWYLAIPIVLAVPAVILFVRYPFFAIFLWILFVPYFIVSPTMAERYIFWILYRAMLPTVLLLMLLSHMTGVRKLRPVQLGRAELAMVIFLGLTLVNIFMIGSDTKKDFINFYENLFIPFCLYWLIRLAPPSKRDLRLLLWAVFPALIFQCAIGLLTWFTPEMLPDKWLGLEGARTVGTVRNVAVYTSFLLFLGLLLFHYAVSSATRWLKPILIVTFGLALFCVFFSFSRGSWLGELLVVVGLLFLYPRVILSTVATVLVITLVLGNSILASQINWAMERLNDEDTANGRIIGNTASMRMIESKPLSGWGWGNYDLYNVSFKSRVGDIAIDTKGTSHNTYLTIMAELGIPAFLVYMFPVGWWLYLSLKVWRRMPPRTFLGSRLLIMFWLLMLHIFVVTNFMDMIRFHPFGTCIWWMTLALIASMVQGYLKPGDIGAPKWAYEAVQNARPS